MSEQRQFTRYEIARILGARALQIAMDAPLLLKITDDELQAVKFDALRIAEKEFDSGVLPISVRRPLPSKKAGKLEAAKEEKVDDRKIIEKEKEIEEEITEKASEMGFVEKDDDTNDETSSDEEQ